LQNSAVPKAELPSSITNEWLSSLSHSRRLPRFGRSG
jgi:hypothetical protein